MFKTIMIFIVAVFACGTAFAQNHESNIFNKKWYAIKIFTGEPTELKKTEIAAEEDCASFPLNRPYFFYMDFHQKGFIRTDHRFGPGVPLQCWISNDELTIRYSTSGHNDVVLQIINSTEDFLQLSGPGSKTYFLISNHILE